jgi:signal transduction histidine kinase
MLVFSLFTALELSGQPQGAARDAAIGIAAVAVGCWALSHLAERRRWPQVARAALLGATAVAAGVLIDQAQLAIGLLATVGVIAGSELALPAALAVVVAGLASLGLTTLVTAMPAAYAWSGVTAALLGLLGGVSRANARRHERDVAEQALAEDRFELARERSEVLAERNRVARDIHDVLAHSLGALAVQLEAADALLEQGQAGQAGDLVRRSREMALTGLEEARRAVRALREEGPTSELAAELSALLRREPVGSGAGELRVAGRPRPLPPAASQALYRAAQEALANARKHAPGAPVDVCLEYGQNGTRLVVENGTHQGNGALAASGGGVGLAAMRERLALAGGSLEAGPAQGGGWRVEATVP